MVRFRHIIVNTLHKGANNNTTTTTLSGGGGGSSSSSSSSGSRSSSSNSNSSSSNNNNNNIKSKSMNGQLYQDLERPLIDKKKSNMVMQLRPKGRRIS